MLSEIECLVAERFGVGESPVWDGARNRLYWTDNTSGNVHAIDLATRERHVWTFDGLVGSLGLARSGRLLVAWADTVSYLEPDTDARETLVSVDLPPSVWKFNDGKVGPDGAFWVGTMDDRGLATREPLAALYRVAGDGSVERKVEGVSVSNGLAWTPDGRTMFHSDSSGRWLDRWDFDPATGAIGNRKRIAMLDEATGRPDGGACDAEGYYWSAGVSAARLNRIDRDGKIVASHPVPVAAPTMPCFGGPDLRTLFVTSLRAGRSPELLEKYPLTGITIMGESPVAGAPVGLFRDR
jgi:sugar lactone lactonase YvrE